MGSKIVFLFLLVCGINRINAGYYVDDYYISIPDKLDWWGAWRYCTQNGMYLVDLPHDKEYLRVFNALTSLKNETNIESDLIWTAGTSATNGFNWYWITTGQPLVGVEWASGSPHDLWENQCVSLSNEYDYLPVDVPCQSQLVFMCRKNWVSPYLNSKSCH